MKVRRRMSGLVPALVHANVDSLRAGQLVYVDPKEWPVHFEMGILTLATEEQVRDAGYEVPE